MMDRTIKRNIILTDFYATKEFPFCEGLSNQSQIDFDVEYAISTGGMGHLRRIWKYFTFPLKIYLNRKSYQRIIAYQQFYGVLLAFYCKLFGARKNFQLIIMTFIYKPKRGFLGSIYQCFMKYATSGKYIDKFVVFSKEEVISYNKVLGIPLNKLYFTPLCMSEIYTIEDDARLLSLKYILSVGRSNRDYDFLVEVLNGQKYTVEIISDTYKNDNCKPNIHLHNKIFGMEMLRWMHNCYCVVIPLKDLNISSGQLVLLQAMQLRKPIIVTESAGTKDYIINGYNGILIHNNATELIAALKVLYQDKALYQKLVRNGYDEYKKKYSMDTLTRNIASIL